MYLPWMSDPATARKHLKQTAVTHVRNQLRDQGLTQEQLTSVISALWVALAEVTAEEYPTPLEYIEAVQDAVCRVQQVLGGKHEPT